MIFTKRIYSADQLRREFDEYGRDYYSYGTYDALLDYFEECYPDGYELDVIAICCDLSEATFEEIAADYSIEASDEEEGLTFDDVIEFLEDNTHILYADEDEDIISYWSF
jgi:hypothetical protein